MQRRTNRSVVQKSPAVTARLLLYGIILGVCWSPRIRLAALPGQDVDIRVQDLLIVVALVYLLFAPPSTVRTRWSDIWGQWLPAFLYIASLTTIFHLYINHEVSFLIRIAFLGRTIEMFILAIVVSGLYLRAGISIREVGRILRVGIWANLAWIGFQSAIGVNMTLFGDVGDLIESYGPKLIGEPSAFGTGAFLMFAVAVTVADYRVGALRRPAALITLVTLVAAAYAVESRVNLVGIIVLLTFLSRHRLRSLVNVPLTVLLGLGGLAALMIWGDQLVGRLSIDGIIHGIQVRLDIWNLMAQYAGDHFIIGLGPGGLTSPGFAWDEAHNIVVRAWLDFGILGAVVLSAILIRLGHVALRAARVDQPIAMRWVGFLTALTLLGTLLAGMVQDSLTVVTPTHLLMTVVGIFAAEKSKSAASNHDKDLIAAPRLLTVRTRESRSKPTTK